MTIESATYISQLAPANPADSDAIPEGDNHIRLLKSVLQAQFTNLGAAAVTVTAAQLNDVVNKAPLSGGTYTGTHNFTGATAVTIPTPTTGTQAATKAYVDGVAISATAPTWSVTTTATSKTLAAFEFCRVSASGQTITFPASPTSGVTRIGIEFMAGITGTLDPNGAKIKESSGTMTCNKPGLTLVFTYIDSTSGWVLGA